VPEQAVKSAVLSLLRELMERPTLAGFAMGGGTALALLFGHRQSLDIDLFSRTAFDSSAVLADLQRRFPDCGIVNRTPGSLSAIVQGIKLDLLLHEYPQLFPDASVEGIRLVSLPDLSAMKVNAVTNRGSKKDFTDLLLLHDQGLSLSAALENFCRKYGEAGRFLALRSLIWFVDAEEEPDPLYLNGWTWAAVRSRMTALGNALHVS
jgi:pimeloyl-ACP methyl ester carboxylesterase